MDELPDLPFELVVSYLGLQDFLKSRAVSRSWKTRIDNHRVNSLCCSNRARDFIMGKSCWVKGEFEQNFIGTTRFAIFYSTFGQSVLCNLRRLRFCDLDLDKLDAVAFNECLGSFSQLEELDIIRFKVATRYNGQPLPFRPHWKLSLPMLRRIHLKDFCAIYSVTLNAPRLQKVRIDGRFPHFLKLVHVDSVERVIIYEVSQIAVAHLKNLKQLTINVDPLLFSHIDSTLLSGLEQLREIYLNGGRFLSSLFDQKQRYGHTELKIYLRGVLLDGPEDPAMNCHNILGFFTHLTENQTRLADEMTFEPGLYLYADIEHVAPELATNVLKRFIDLNEIYVNGPVQDIPRFINFLKNFDIVELTFTCDHPQDLFDRLPEHCTVQKLTLQYLPSDPAFLFRFENVLEVNINITIHRMGADPRRPVIRESRTLNIEIIRRFFEQLQFASSFKFNRGPGRSMSIEVKKRITKGNSIQFYVAVQDTRSTVPNLNAAIKIIKNKLSKKLS